MLIRLPDNLHQMDLVVYFFHRSQAISGVRMKRLCVCTGNLCPSIKENFSIERDQNSSIITDVLITNE